LTGFIVSAALLEAWIYHGRRTELLVWNPIPGVIGAGIEVGSIAGWLLGLLALSISLRLNRQAEHSEFENPSDQIGDLGAEAPSDFESYDDFEADSSGISDPYEVLNISRGVSIADIKDAYRSAIKKCHPDCCRSKPINPRCGRSGSTAPQYCI
jgi:hypothetical protein